MQRRTFLKLGLVSSLVKPAVAALNENEFDAAARILAESTSTGQVRAASLLVKHGDQEFTQSFGECKSEDDIFLIASISKPMAVAAVMTLHESGGLALDDPVMKFLPEFRGESREETTLRHLLTHVSGLPDQLPENASLRKRHAPLAEFVQHALKTPLRFKPG